MAAPEGSAPSGGGDGSASSGSATKKRERSELRASASPLFGDLPLLADKYVIEHHPDPANGGRSLTLGGGTFGTVMVARASPHTRVALKCLNLPPVSSETRRDRERYARREMKALRQVEGHVNVIELLEVRRDEYDKIYLVFPLVHHDLLGLMHDEGTNMPPAQVKGYVRQVFVALQWCHARGVMHRDVKPENILVTADNVVKLADFGMAREHVLNYAQYTRGVQTMWYRAPELLLGASDYGPANDVWAAGCVAGYCLMLRPLFPGTRDDEQLPLIYAVCGTPRDIDTAWPPSLREAAAKSFKGGARPSALGYKLGAGNVSFRRALFTPGAIAVLQGALDTNPLTRAGWDALLAMPYFTQEAPAPYTSEQMRRYSGAHRRAKIK